MKVLITGGFGYVGGRLAEFLTSRGGYEILLGSRRQAEAPAWLPRAKAVQALWDSAPGLEQICDGVDVIVHLARMNARDCTADPVAALEFNAVATARLLRAAVRRGVKRFIYLSTAHVYVSPLRGTITEETHPVSLDPYATSQRAGEDAVRAAHQRGEIVGTVVRLSNSYGAPAHKDANCWMLLVNDLCRQAVTTRRMTLQSSGLQRRNFVPLSDACRAIDHLINLPALNNVKDIYNVGGDWSPTIWEVACFVQERCAVVLGYHPQLTRIAPNAGETAAELDYRFDVLRQSGFQPGFDRAGEIDRLLEFCRTAFT